MEALSRVKCRYPFYNETTNCTSRIDGFIGTSLIVYSIYTIICGVCILSLALYRIYKLMYKLPQSSSAVRRSSKSLNPTALYWRTYLGVAIAGALTILDGLDPEGLRGVVPYSLAQGFYDLRSSVCIFACIDLVLYWIQILISFRPVKWITTSLIVFRCFIVLPLGGTVTMAFLEKSIMPMELEGRGFINLRLKRIKYLLYGITLAGTCVGTAMVGYRVVVATNKVETIKSVANQASVKKSQSSGNTKRDDKAKEASEKLEERDSRASPPTNASAPKGKRPRNIERKIVLGFFVLVGATAFQVVGFIGASGYCWKIDYSFSVPTPTSLSFWYDIPSLLCMAACMLLLNSVRPPETVNDSERNRESSSTKRTGAKE
jgi:hypothetical protein